MSGVKTVNCPKCQEPLNVLETEVKSNAYLSSPVVYSCASCGCFLGIAPEVLNYETQIGNIDSAVGELCKQIQNMLLDMSKLKTTLEKGRNVSPAKKKK